jgi:hypothetical protein
MQSDATTVEGYLAELTEDRRDIVSAVRAVVIENLPDGYEESMRWGMISYEVPLARYPNTYNGQPLSYAGLASQKRHLALYLNNVYSSPDGGVAFAERYRATGKKLDMGKSCVRFRQLDDLPLDLVAQVIAGTSVDKFISTYESARRKG